MTSVNDLTLSVMFPSRFLKCDDLQGRKVTVTIADVNLEEVMMVGGSHEKKVVLQLAKTPKLLIAGRTNGFSIALLLSQHIREWVGKRITLCPDVDLFGKSEVPCIRVAGSPDSAPENTAAYARAWKGDRKRGKLLSRVKKELVKLAPKHAQPVEPEEPEVDDDLPPPSSQEPDDFLKDSEPA
jgi:hypothetical protein